MDSNTLKTVVLGKVPVYRDEYNSSATYYKYNIVTYYGSCFISNTDNNTNPPLVNATADASGLIISYDGLSDGWSFFANVIDGNIHAVSAGDYAKEMGEYAQTMGDSINGLVSYDASVPKLTVGEPASTQNKNLVKIGLNVHDASLNNQSTEERGQVLIGNNFTSAQPGVFVYTSEKKAPGEGEFDKMLASNNKTSHCIVACDVSINNPTYSGTIGGHPNVILGAHLYHTYGTQRAYGTLIGQYNDEIDSSVPNNANTYVSFVLGAGTSHSDKFNPITIYKENNNYYTLLDGNVMARKNGSYTNINTEIENIDASLLSMNKTLIAHDSSLDDLSNNMETMDSSLNTTIRVLDNGIASLYTSIQDIYNTLAVLSATSIVVVDTPITGTLYNLEIGKYYRFDVVIDEVVFNFPAVQQTGGLVNIVLYFTTGSDINIKMASTLPIDKFNGFNIEDNKTYEINAIFNGSRWILASSEVTKEN